MLLEPFYRISGSRYSSQLYGNWTCYGLCFHAWHKQIVKIEQSFGHQNWPILFIELWFRRLPHDYLFPESIHIYSIGIANCRISELPEQWFEMDAKFLCLKHGICPIILTNSFSSEQISMLPKNSARLYNLLDQSCRNPFKFSRICWSSIS